MDFDDFVISSPDPGILLIFVEIFVGFLRKYQKYSPNAFLMVLVHKNCLGQSACAIWTVTDHSGQGYSGFGARFGARTLKYTFYSQI